MYLWCPFLCLIYTPEIVHQSNSEISMNVSSYIQDYIYIYNKDTKSIMQIEKWGITKNFCVKVPKWPEK